MKELRVSVDLVYVLVEMWPPWRLFVVTNPSRNWTIQRFATVAEKERTQLNKLKT